VIAGLPCVSTAASSEGYPHLRAYEPLAPLNARNNFFSEHQLAYIASADLLINLRERGPLDAASLMSFTGPRKTTT
jgi:hypothetical protein